jgi:acyl-coenzyme A synthetase/AMP-(fatty) acid ligase
LNPAGQEISADDEDGEIFIRGPGIMSGYLGDEVATRESTSNGWFRTGDVGYCRKGKWYIVDRAKDIIKVRGWQVSPAEIEACVLNVAGVRDVAIVRSVQEDGSELPAAYVVPDKTVLSLKMLESEVKRYVKEHLASFKSLDGGVVFVEQIPRTASGKTQRRLL